MVMSRMNAVPMGSMAARTFWSQYQIQQVGDQADHRAEAETDQDLRVELHCSLRAVLPGACRRGTAAKLAGPGARC
jgi:hypothetical protein